MHLVGFTIQLIFKVRCCNIDQSRSTPRLLHKGRCFDNHSCTTYEPVFERTIICPSGLHNKKIIESLSIFRAFAKLLKVTINFATSVYPSVRPPSWNNSAPAGRPSIKFYIGGGEEHFSKNCT